MGFKMHGKYGKCKQFTVFLFFKLLSHEKNKKINPL